jgi:glutaredoxin
LHSGWLHNYMRPMNKPIVYTLSTCPACIRLKEDWVSRGREFEERQVDDNQAWLDEALSYGNTVPIVVYEDGRVEIGYANMISCYIA